MRIASVAPVRERRLQCIPGRLRGANDAVLRYVPAGDQRARASAISTVGV
jgi:hypothetical protein